MRHDQIANMRILACTPQLIGAHEPTTPATEGLNHRRPRPYAACARQWAAVACREPTLSDRPRLPASMDFLIAPRCAGRRLPAGGWLNRRSGFFRIRSTPQLFVNHVDDGRIRQRGDVSEFTVLGHIAQESPHDLAGTGLG